MNRQNLNQLIAKTIKQILIDNKKVIEQLGMSSYNFYQFKNEYPEQILIIKKGLLVQNVFIDIKVPDDFLFNTPDAIKGDNDKMIELYKLGSYAETLLKVDIFTALIKPDNKKD